MKLVRSGSRPDIPPLDQLPGPSPAGCPGMEDYMQLIRWAAAGNLALLSAQASALQPPAQPALSGTPTDMPRRDCWAQDPAQRPGFASIAPRLHALLEQLGYGAAEV